MKKREIKQRVFDILTCSKTYKQLMANKMFCYGFITALVDSEIITQGEYMYLNDTIYLWKLGDISSQMGTIKSMLDDGR